MEEYLKKINLFEGNSTSNTKSIISRTSYTASTDSTKTCFTGSTISRRTTKKKRKRRRRKKTGKKRSPKEVYAESLKKDTLLINYLKDLYFFDPIFVILMYYNDKKEVIRNLNFLLYFLIQKEYDVVDLNLEDLFKAIYEDQDKRKREEQVETDRASRFFFPDLIRRTSSVGGREVYKRIIKNSNLNKLRAAGLHPTKNKKEKIEKKHKMRRQKLIQNRIKRKLEASKTRGKIPNSIINNHQNKRGLFFQLPQRRRTPIEDSFFDYFLIITKNSVTEDILKLLYEKTERNIIQFIIELQFLFGRSATSKLFSKQPYHYCNNNSPASAVKMTKREFWRLFGRFLNNTRKGFEKISQNKFDEAEYTKIISLNQQKRIFKAYIDDF